MRRALVLAGLVVLAGCAGTRTATSLPGLDAAKLAKLRAIALSTAKGAKDPHPSSVMVYASRRHEANIAAGAGTGVFGEDPVYLVVLRGDFIVSPEPAPGPMPPHKSNVITFVVTRDTLRQLDYGFGGTVNTSSVGPGLPLRVG